jgi:hypothetical protein
MKTYNPSYKHLKAKAQRTIRQESRLYWQNYCSSLNTNSKLNRVWAMERRVQGVRSTHITSDLNHKGVSVSLPSEKATLFASYFQTVNSNNNYSEPFASFRPNSIRAYLK